ncbi:MAG: hypothetical protein FJZ96_06180 [Chloroflexi bacterium]|nr:hypothetical protein [Chloroflexota bacterium]
MTEDLNTPLETTDVPPPPKKKNTGLIIGIVVAVVLCCCCIGAIGLGWAFWPNIQYALGLY